MQNEFEAKEALLAEALAFRPECFGGMYEPLDGGDMVEWFSAWRDRVNALTPLPGKPAIEWPVRGMLDCSTAHITEQDDQRLTEMAASAGGPVHDMGPGYLVHVFQLDDSPDRFEGLSAAFHDVVRHARERGCDFVLLDPDGAHIDDLDTFDW